MRIAKGDAIRHVIHLLLFGKNTELLNNDVRNSFMRQKKSISISKKEEYIMLHNEIIFHMNKLHELSNMMYISSVAILAFIYKGNSPDNSILYLLPFAVIIPSYINSLRHSVSINIIGSYLKIFLVLEKKEF